MLNTWKRLLLVLLLFVTLAAFSAGTALAVDEAESATEAAEESLAGVSTIILTVGVLAVGAVGMTMLGRASSGDEEQN